MASEDGYYENKCGLDSCTVYNCSVVALGKNNDLSEMVSETGYTLEDGEWNRSVISNRYFIPLKKDVRSFVRSLVNYELLDH